VSTRDQLADLLTKPLTVARFNHLRTNLHVQELPIRLRGCIELRSVDHVEDCAATKNQAKPQQAKKT
jgi:hypothetical protein